MTPEELAAFPQEGQEIKGDGGRKFVIGKVLGQGTNGAVYETDNNEYAVKIEKKLPEEATEKEKEDGKGAEKIEEEEKSKEKKEEEEKSKEKKEEEEKSKEKKKEEEKSKEKKEEEEKSREKKEEEEKSKEKNEEEEKSNEKNEEEEKSNEKRREEGEPAKKKPKKTSFVGISPNAEIVKDFMAKSQKERKEWMEKAREPLKRDIVIMKQMKGAKHFCLHIDSGEIEGGFLFAVMTRLGKNLSKLRRERPSGKFTRSTALRIGYQTLNAVKALHDNNFLSRDVKPGNFVVGIGERSRVIHLIDFGYANIANAGGPRSGVGFVGTMKYASARAHAPKDLGKMDDVASWFYSLVDMTKGQLPWKHYKKLDHNGIMALKKAATDNPTTLLHGCPSQYTDIHKYIFNNLFFHMTPNYGVIQGYLEEAAKKENIDLADERNFRWDWDT